MIIFKRVKYKNFLPVGNKPIEIQLDNHPVTVVTGHNGAGKTSGIIDAIYFALYGKTFRKIKKEQIVNSINRKNCVVELEFEKNGKNYVIVRGLAPKILRVFIDGNEIKQDSKMRDFQRYIENEIVGMNEKTMRQLVFLGSSNFVPFMKLPAAERRMIIEDILDLQIFTNMLEKAKENVSLLTQEKITLNGKVDVIKSNIDVQKETLRRFIASKKNHEKMLKENIENKKETVKQFEKEIEKIERKIYEYNEEIKNIGDVRKKINELKYMLKRLEGEKKKIKNEIKFFDTETICPKCYRPMDNDVVIEKHKKELHEKLKKLESAIDIGKNMMNDLNEKKRKVEDLEKKIKDLNVEKNKFEAKMYAIIKSIEEIEKSKSGIKEDDIKHIVQQIEKSENEYNEIKTKIDTIDEEISYYSVIIDLLKDSGVKSRIIKHYLPILNSFIRKYLEILEFPIEFLFDEQFNEIIKSRYRDVFSYENFSEGQKMRIDLAILFAFRDIAALKNSVSCNLIVLDEVGSSSLDSDGTEAFMKIISEISNKNNVFIISHDVSMLDNDIFTRHIEYRLKDGFATVKIVETQ